MYYCLMKSLRIFRSFYSVKSLRVSFWTFQKNALVHPTENNFIHIKWQREGCPHNPQRDLFCPQGNSRTSKTHFKEVFLVFLNVQFRNCRWILEVNLSGSPCHRSAPFPHFGTEQILSELSLPSASFLTGFHITAAFLCGTNTAFNVQLETQAGSDKSFYLNIPV